MKILALILLFIFLRMIFRTFFFIEKKDVNPSNEEKNEKIIDVEYEELE